jgi:uncharacterized membrane protein
MTFKGINMLENVTLALSTVVFGVMAGFFWTYSFNVNLAMLQVDGSVYAEVQSLFNQNVRHFMFFSFFFGGGAFGVFAVVANIRRYKSAPFMLILLATVIYIAGVIVFTQQVNLPLNYYTESWDIDHLPADWSAIRDQWNDANIKRVYVSFLSFVMCVVALMLRAIQAKD